MWNNSLPHVLFFNNSINNHIIDFDGLFCNLNKYKNDLLPSY